ncbi:sulfotransferase family protein [Mycolicibacterium flavescens]|uniref:sulfotransferase family protein n=1 Tax=Mycobacterium neumannii TaxID=2048551 RepID=UPI000B94237B|nr:sulfotransferase [Mycobacterium neumannii]VEG46420.1 sulfotransferase family protein [Mycolicibacterium flavescens]
MSQFDDVTTSDDVLRLAMEATGVSQTQSESWRPGLDIMLDELATSTAFSAHGRDYIIDNCVKALARRLKVDDYAEKHHEVLDAPVERPIFVLGMPRTGTTVISYLLDQDPTRRSLLHWECVHPIPPATTDTLRTDPRCLALIEEQNQLLNALRSAHMSVPHWEDADGPTECMFIHNQDFKGLSWDAFLKTSRYTEWLFEEADMTTTYEYQKRYLQVLQSTAPGTWSLKMPSHSVHIEALLKVFPDARLIWAHRDPYRATGSLANLWRLPKQLTLQPDSIDLADMGRQAQWQMSYHVDRPLRARERIGDERFFHMYYSEMMRDPLDVMRRIYAWTGDPLTEDTERRMRSWLAAHPQDHYGTNTYSLDEYSLTVKALEPTFAEYLDTFPIELEAKA